MSNGTEIQGEVPTTTIEALESAAAALGPDRSLSRVEAGAKFLLASAAAVGAVLTGFGVLGAEVLDDRLEWALPSIALAAISIALAAWALVGNRDDVNLDDLADVASFYEHQIAWRGAVTRVAGIVFAVSILAGMAPLIAAAVDDSPVTEGGGHIWVGTPQRVPGGFKVLIRTRESGDKAEVTTIDLRLPASPRKDR